MRAYDEQAMDRTPGRPDRRAAAVAAREAAAPPGAVLTALQRTAGNAAVARLLAGRGGPAALRDAVVQRAPVRRERRRAANDSPYSGRPRSARQQEQRGFDPAEARPQQLPVAGPAGETIWSGTRRDIGFTPETVAAVLAGTESRVENGRTEYRCAVCDTFIPRLGARRDDDGNRYVTIDHVSGIIAYVQSRAEVMSWQVGGRRVHAISRAEAKRWANDLDNLRVLCAQPCNGGTRAARSESRRYDTDKAVWWAG
ncbi:hypothetical protein [Streptomyces sp. NPDC018031]|uniref:hypothetical protein n=1 Tax=Streptomyces sp. NPDC018031 TaxID=3365033 RepID=UPI0037B83A96